MNGLDLALLLVIALLGWGALWLHEDNKRLRRWFKETEGARGGAETKEARAARLDCARHARQWAAIKAGNGDYEAAETHLKKAVEFERGGCS